MGTSSQAVARGLAPTGVLRASINLGNPVLTRGSAADPGGITVDLAREIAARLGVPAELLCFDAARDSFDALRSGRADIGFIAIEPARQAELWFTEPYVLIEGVYVVPDDSPIDSADDVDRAGIRVGVNSGSAYDLFLTRTLTQADIVRGPDAVELFRTKHLDAIAGIRQPQQELVANDPGLRIVEPRFMQIRQAVATTPDRPVDVREFLHALVEELKSNGFVAAALERSGQQPSLAATS